MVSSPSTAPRATATTRRTRLGRTSRSPTATIPSAGIRRKTAGARSLSWLGHGEARPHEQERQDSGRPAQAPPVRVPAAARVPPRPRRRPDCPRSGWSPWWSGPGGVRAVASSSPRGHVRRAPSAAVSCGTSPGGPSPSRFATESCAAVLRRRRATNDNVSPSPDEAASRTNAPSLYGPVTASVHPPPAPAPPRPSIWG